MTTPETPRPIVRRARPDDLRSIMDIKSDPDVDVLADGPRYYERIPRTVIVESGGLAVAYAIWKDEVWTDGPGEPKRSRILTDVHVREDHRRAGFGALAVDGAAWVLLDDADADRHPDRTLMASVPSHNLTGRDFLDAIGFAHAGNVYYQGAGMVRMERDFYYRDFGHLPPELGGLPEGMAAPAATLDSSLEAAPETNQGGRGHAWY